MAGHPVVLFCKICGTGINLVRGDAIYKCVECEISPICRECYDNKLKMCNLCASDILKKQQEENAREMARRQEEVVRQNTIKNEEIKKKSANSIENKKCYNCGNQGSFFWPLYKCPSCKIFFCGTCLKEISRCPACNISLK
jgi:hypothetical protein